MTLDDLRELEGLIRWATTEKWMKPSTPEEEERNIAELTFNGVLDCRIGRWGIVDLRAQEIEAERNRIPFGEVGPCEGSCGFYYFQHPDGRRWSLTPPGVEKLINEKDQP